MNGVGHYSAGMPFLKVRQAAASGNHKRGDPLYAQEKPQLHRKVTVTERQPLVCALVTHRRKIVSKVIGRQRIPQFVTTTIL